MIVPGEGEGQGMGVPENFKYVEFQMVSLRDR